MKTRSLVQRTVCFMLSAGLLLTGLPGAGPVTGLAAQYEIQEGEIPAKASSLEDLPSVVNCVEAGASIQTPKNITWEAEESGSFYNAGSEVKVTGTITENGQKVSATVLAVPEKVVYLVDANAYESDRSKDFKRFQTEGNTSFLKNTVPDQAYIQGSWGVTGNARKKGAVPELKDTKGYTGYYAEGGEAISYKLPLESGTYIVAAEFAEWWGNYSRTVDMKITYSDSSGKAVTKVLDTASMGARLSTDTAVGSFTIDNGQEVRLDFQRKDGTSEAAVLSGFTVIKAKEELPDAEYIPVTIDGDKIDKINTFGGFGSVTCNNTSRLLMDYKALHEDKYWKMMELLFDREKGAGLNHVKIELGADVNSSSGTEPATMRSSDETPNVRRGAGFMFAADAKSINPDISVEILRWGELKWTQEGIGYEEYDNPKFEARYQWYRKTIDAVYETYGYKITEVSPGQNERRKDYPDNFAWIKYCAQRFKEDGENGVGAFDYEEIKIVAADLYRGMGTTVEYMMKDQEFRDLVDVISDHYQIWLGSRNLDILNQEYGKEVWYGESTAPMINANYRANVDPLRGGIGGSAGIAAMAERLISAYAYKNADGYTSHMTELLFQPAIGAFYEGSAYSPKQLIGAFDPWSGYYEADGGIQMAEHFMKFADNDWNYLPDACYSDGKTGDGDIVADSSTDTRLALKDPVTDDYSVIFANNTSVERKYHLTLKNLKTVKNSYNIWETRGPDDGEAYDANWFQKIAEESQPHDNGDGTTAIELVVKPYSIVTLTSLTGRGTSYTAGQNDSGVERKVLGLPYRDNFDYEDSFIEERGGTPYFTTDLEGAFEVCRSEDTGYVLKQMINGENRPYNWNPWGSGSDESSQTTAVPWTVLGDHRWANYTAGIDVKLDTKGKGYGDNFAVLGVREVVHSSGAAYRAKIYDNGSWELLRFNKVQKSGKLEKFIPDQWHRLELKADENVITLYIDGEETGNFTDESSPVMTGRVSLMSGFWNTSFDNLTVMPIEGKAAYASEKPDDTSPLIRWTGNVTHNIGQGFAFYNRSYTVMSPGSAMEFVVPDGTGFDIFGKSGSAKVKVTVDNQEEDAVTLNGGDRETTFWKQNLPAGQHKVKLEVTQGTYQVDGINLLAEAATGYDELHTKELEAMIRYVKEREFDSAKYPEALINQVKAALSGAEEVLAEGASQKEVDLARIALRNAVIRVVPSDTIVSIKEELGTKMVVQDGIPKLPDMVTVINAAGEESLRNVSWEIEDKEFGTLWDTVEVIGEIEETGFKLSTSVVVIPYGLTWFIDSGVADVEDSEGEAGHSSFYDLIADSVELENKRADQRYTEGSWGYVDDKDVAVKGSGSISYNTGIYDSGLYVDHNKDTDIIYKLPMKAGKYRFMLGAQAYWNETHSGKVELRYETAEGEEKTVELGTATVSASDNNISFSQAAEIPVDGMVEVRVRNAGTKIHLISWLAVAREADAELPAVLITEQGKLPKLPETVIVNGEELEVEWKKRKESDFSVPWTSVNIKGEVAGIDLPVIIPVEVIPEKLRYFIDSGVTENEESSFYNAVNEAAGGLLNELPDKMSDGQSWGYADRESLGGPMGEGSDSRSKTGWWAKEGKEIVYKLPLEAGTYQFTGGFYEWWSVKRPMEGYVVYENETGEKMTVSLGKITISKPEEAILKPKTDIVIPMDQIIEFRVRKTGDSDPVISWIAVNEKSEAALPEEDIYHTTNIKVTQKPIKEQYEVGQELDKTGMEVRRYEKASPSHAVREIVLEDDDYEVVYDFSEPGKKKVTVSYSEWDEDGTGKTFTDSFTVTVQEKLVEEEYYTKKISVTRKPRKVKYIVGEDLDRSGMEVTEYRKASPSHAVRKHILSEEEYDTEYDFSVSGTRKVKVIYYGTDKRGEEKRFTDSFTVNVIEDKDVDTPVLPGDTSDDSDDGDNYHSGRPVPEPAYYYGTWIQDNKGWKLKGTDGTFPKNRWALVKEKHGEEWYFFDENGYMLTGWLQYRNQQYYLNPVSDGTKGRMVTGWQQIDNVWYYFDKTEGENKGSMLKNTVTPDGYKVGLNGAWVR